MAPDVIEIEVVYAGCEEQQVLALSVPRGTTARQALERSGLATRFPELAAEQCPLGIFGRRVGADTMLEAGDRVEIYRPLQTDPKQARRRRAARR